MLKRSGIRLSSPAEIMLSLISTSKNKSENNKEIAQMYRHIRHECSPEQVRLARVTLFAFRPRQYQELASEWPDHRDNTALFLAALGISETVAERLYPILRDSSGVEHELLESFLYHGSPNTHQRLANRFPDHQKRYVTKKQA